MSQDDVIRGSILKHIMTGNFALRSNTIRPYTMYMKTNDIDVPLLVDRSTC